MIWVKMKLKIMPESCARCVFSVYHEADDARYCTITRMLYRKIKHNGVWKYIRPADCPLKEE